MAKNNQYKSTRPPRLPDRFLQWYCHPDLLEEIQGDLHEVFLKNTERLGVRRANWIYALQVLLFFRLSTIKKITLNFSFIMWRNYLTISLRNMLKYKGFTLLNVLGLSVGLATALTIMLWIQDEIAYDKNLAEDEQLYRVMRNMFLDGGKIVTTASVPFPLEEELPISFPEIEAATVFSWEMEMVVGDGQNAFRKEGRFVGRSFLEYFAPPLIQGDPATALESTTSAVISEDLARQLYGTNSLEEGNVLGQPLKIGIDSFDTFTITGVYENIPTNSTFHYDLALSEALYRRNNSWVNDWTNNGYRMYIKVRPETDIAALNQKIKPLIRQHAEGEEADLFLQRYSDMHLYSQFENGQVQGGRIAYVRIFAMVGIFILLIAGINFMNLSTARSSQRAKEIGVRKTIGATRRNLIGQFITESTLLTACSLVVAIGMTYLFLPAFNELTGKAIHINWISPQTWLMFLSLLVIVGLFSGSYPAFFLSNFPILQVLKGNRLPKAGYTNVRRGLVVFQFVLSNLLIISTLTCYRQIQFIKNKNLGYNKENVVHIPVEGALRSDYELFKERALQHPEVLSVSAASQLPTEIGWSTGGVQWAGRDPTSNIEISVLVADYDLVETLGMELIDGRLHGRNFALDSANIVINEAAAKVMNMDDPIGEKISMWEADGEIIGLVKDFHFNSMYAPIEPLVIRLNPVNASAVFARISGENTEGTLAYLQGLAQEMNPDFPFTYGFLDEAYATTYQSEHIIGSLAKYFSMIAIFISCLGLFGLAIFAAEQRYKEVSIRKVLGASIGNLVVLLAREFIFLVLLAFVIAIPIAWYVSSGWLSAFAYKTSLGVGIFLIAGLLTLGIAVLTVSFEAVKAAMSNPVGALNKE